jgi:hypothetical protein
MKRFGCSRRSSCSGAARICRSSRCNGVRSCPGGGCRYGAGHIADACMVVFIECAGDERRARQDRRPHRVRLGLKRDILRLAQSEGVNHA